MFKLPEFEITVHIDINEFSKSLETQINDLSKNYDLHRSTEYGGRRDYKLSQNRGMVEKEPSKGLFKRQFSL